jgi:hypothetical protein
VGELKHEFTNLYLEERSNFTQDILWNFNILVKVRHHTILMKWEANPLDLNFKGAWGGHTMDYNTKSFSCISRYNDIKIIMKLVFFTC